MEITCLQIKSRAKDAARPDLHRTTPPQRRDPVPGELPTQPPDGCTITGLQEMRAKSDHLKASMPGYVPSGTDGNAQSQPEQILALKEVLRGMLARSQPTQETRSAFEESYEVGKLLEKYDRSLREFIRRADQLEEDLAKRIININTAGRTATALLDRLRKQETEIREVIRTQNEENRSPLEAILKRGNKLWGQLTALIERFEFEKNTHHNVNEEQIIHHRKELEKLEVMIRNSLAMSNAYDKQLDYGQKHTQQRHENLVLVESSLDNWEAKLRTLSLDLVDVEDQSKIERSREKIEESKNILNRIRANWSRQEAEELRQADLAESKRFEQEFKEVKQEAQIIQKTMWNITTRQSPFKNLSQEQAITGMKSSTKQWSATYARMKSLQERAITAENTKLITELINFGEEIWSIAHHWDYNTESSDPRVNIAARKRKIDHEPLTTTAKKSAISDVFKTVGVENPLEGTDAYWDLIVRKKKKTQPKIEPSTEEWRSSENILKMLQRNTRMVFGIPRGAVLELMDGSPTENTLIVRLTTAFKPEAFTKDAMYSLVGDNERPALYERGEMDPRIQFCYEASVIRFPLSEDAYPYALRKAFLREALMGRLRGLRCRKAAEERKLNLVKKMTTSDVVKVVDKHRHLSG